MIRKIPDQYYCNIDLYPLTCSEISAVWMVRCSGSSDAFCSRKNRKHSMVAKTIAAHSEGLDIARSLERLEQMFMSENMFIHGHTLLHSKDHNKKNFSATKIS